MSRFWHRWEADTSAPSWHEWRRDVLRRALLPAAALWCLVVGTGSLITGPLGGLPGERVVNEWFVHVRTPTLDAVTTGLSAIGQTEPLIGACLVGIAVTWRLTRQWWYASALGLAVALQAAVFLSATVLVGRERPDVELLDEAPPTSSFPSGHTGAAAAFYLTLALMAQRIRHPAARVAVTALCALVPCAVGTARLYRGMHSASDVTVGFLNGATCAVIAWGHLRRSPGAPAEASDAAASAHPAPTGAR